MITHGAPPLPPLPRCAGVAEHFIFCLLPLLLLTFPSVQLCPGLVFKNFLQLDNTGIHHILSSRVPQWLHLLGGTSSSELGTGNKTVVPEPLNVHRS